MRICRYEGEAGVEFGFVLNEDELLPIHAAAAGLGIHLPQVNDIVGLLPGGDHHSSLKEIERRLTPPLVQKLLIQIQEVKILVPIPAPGKMVFLAGNYADHVRETGGQPEDHEKTFPYLFLKPNNTLTNPSDPIRLPEISPSQIDWEIELGVIISQTCRAVAQEDAFKFVAGYTVVNDISDRGFKPNPARTPRPRDAFFDWQHGKWHDTFCPMGPAVLPVDECQSPHELELCLKVNGQTEQHSTTANMIFKIPQIIEFVSSVMTLSPGDIIATGTPAGVGKAKNRFLKRGDTIVATISGIGSLANSVE